MSKNMTKRHHQKLESHQTLHESLKDSGLSIDDGEFYYPHQVFKGSIDDFEAKQADLQVFHHSSSLLSTASNKSDNIYPTLNQIEDVKNGKHINRCIDPEAKPIKYLSTCKFGGNSLASFIKTNYQRNEDGTFEMINTEISQKQKQVLGKVVKQLSTAFLSKKTVTLPLGIFEPRSMLEKVAVSFIYAPLFLEQAAQTMNKLEQFKLTVAFWVASLHTNVFLYKPFNPILGETFQAYIQDSPVYVEQISHHPPICCYQMYGEQYKIEGTYEFQGDVSANGLRAKNRGFPKVSFKNTNSNIIAYMPTFNVMGTMFGKQTFSLANKVVIVDIENQFYTEIEFNADSGFWSKEKKSAKDSISSGIWKVTPCFIEKLKKEMQVNKEINIRFKPKEDAVEQIDSLQGSWITHLQIGSKQYWNFENYLPAQVKKINNPLPSDCTFRLDVLHLKKNEENLAQKYKEELEEIQRRDKKLRQQKNK